jgi:cation:H+ antiporter
VVIMLASLPAMPALVVFGASALVSLGASWLLVTRLERLAGRAGLSEGLLGLLAALAADAPEITSAVTALSHHQTSVGAGVTLGSNVFNLAALLGLGAVVAGRVGLHRKVIVLSGAVGAWIAVACLLAVTGVIPPVGGLAVIAVVFVPYLVVLATHGRRLFPAVPWPGRLAGWMAAAVAEEETEVGEAIQPGPGARTDTMVAALALLVVVLASTVMELTATGLGHRYAVPGIITGGVVLAAVTSLPNAVAAVYLARRGRGAAVLSTALNSNALNVIAGLLIPATITGLGSPATATTLVTGWYAGLTAAVLVAAFAGGGLRRTAGSAIIAAYAVFLGALLATAYG